MDRLENAYRMIPIDRLKINTFRLLNKINEYDNKNNNDNNDVLKQKFDVAVEEVKTAGEWSKAITNDRKLLCYAFFKQVNNGDVTGTQPWAVQFEARSKWDAWNKIKGVSKEKAMEEYVKEWEQQKIDFNMPKE